MLRIARTNLVRPLLASAKALHGSLCGQPGRDDGWGDNVADHSGAGEEQREEGKDAVAGQRGGPFHRLSRPDVTDGLPQDVDGGRKRSGTTHEELLQWSTEARDVTAPRLACD